MNSRPSIEGHDDDDGDIVEVLIYGVADALVGLRRSTERTATPRDKPQDSPYFGVPVDEWAEKTRSLTNRGLSDRAKRRDRNRSP